jgi:hypothetical protein
VVQQLRKAPDTKNEKFTVGCMRLYRVSPI